jgi:hypothetical protein
MPSAPKWEKQERERERERESERGRQIIKTNPLKLFRDTNAVSLKIIRSPKIKPVVKMQSF